MGLLLRFVEAAGTKLVGREFLPTLIVNRVNTKLDVINFIIGMTTFFQEFIGINHSLAKSKETGKLSFVPLLPK